MTEPAIAVDTSAAIDYLRPDRTSPPQIRVAHSVFLPLPVVGELFNGAFGSRHRVEEEALVRNLLLRWTVLTPDINTARLYAEVRVQRKLHPSFSTNLRTDLWIAAICLQHRLPLLTNDRGFDAVPDLRVLHW